MAFSIWSYYFISTNIQSLLFATLCIVVAIVIAHHTNPTEASFRHFLTEQSFRRHLSRIDDPQFEENPNGDYRVLQHPLTRHGHLAKPLQDRTSTAKSSNVLQASTLSRFHFHGHASISLRSPSHVVRSFGILSIAAISPVVDAQQPLPSIKPARLSRQTPAIAACWYVGLLGRWWPGGPIPFDGLVFGSDEEDTRTGVVSVRAVHQPAQFDGLSARSSNGQQAQGATSTLRERAVRESKDDTHLAPPRSSTPPPLPKSVSLPLHDKRSPRRVSAELRAPVGASTTSTPERNSAAALATVPLPEQSPVITSLVNELSASQAAVVEFRAKIDGVESAARKSREALQSELDAQREQKRREDTTRSELRSRTKALEDSKRHTDSTRREAEKRLKAAQTARDGSLVKIEQLTQEAADLQLETTQDEERSRESSADTERALIQVSQDLEQRKREIKVAEELVNTLHMRSRELEERIALETARLRKLKDEADARRRSNEGFVTSRDEVLPRNDSPPLREPTSWPPSIASCAGSVLVGYEQVSQHSRSILRRPAADPPTARLLDREFRPRTNPASNPPSRSNSLKATSSYGAPMTGTLQLNADNINVSKGYAIFNPEIASLQAAAGLNSTFAPFEDSVDSDFVVKPRALPDRHIRANAFLPSAIFHPLDSQAGQVGTIDRPSAAHSGGREGWRGPMANIRGPTFPADGPAVPDVPDLAILLGQSSTADLQRAALLARGMSVAPERPAFISSTARSSTGLNPDAKVFNPPRGRPLLTASPTMALALPALPSAAPSAPASTAFSSQLRAFAPSAAEREAFSRALGSTRGDASSSPPMRSAAAPAVLPRSPFSHPPALDFGWSADPPTSAPAQNPFFPLRKALKPMRVGGADGLGEGRSSR